MQLRDLGVGELTRLLNMTREHDLGGPSDALRGRVVANLFLEDSTRTRLSFTAAAERLGARVLDLVAGASSMNKGESLADTARTVEAMGVDALVVRARQACAPHEVARQVQCAVINAGDGRHEHPTQGLLDTYTLARAAGRDQRAWDLSGLTVGIVGDIAASRVARSAIAAMGALGARLICIGPAPMAPRSLESLGCAVTHDLDAVAGDLDAVMMLRIQFERHGEGRAAPIASVREYRELYALTPERAGRLKAGAIVMHPGPMNRGVEIDAEVADGARSRIIDQVRAGVVARMATLRWSLSA